MRDVLRVSAAQLTPAELIRAILQAPVDLLFAGGIGTFVRASTEDDRSVDDRANSELGFRPRPLRARVVGEGANLAFTQRARIEYARRGGRINARRDRQLRRASTPPTARSTSRCWRASRSTPGEVTREEADDAVLEERRRRRGRRPGRHPAPVRATLDRPGRERRATATGSSASCSRSRRTVRSIRWSSPCPTPPTSTLVEPPARGSPDPSWRCVMAGLKRWLAGELLAGQLPDDPAMQPALDAVLPGRDGGALRPPAPGAPAAPRARRLPGHQRPRRPPGDDVRPSGRARHRGDHRARWSRPQPWRTAWSARPGCSAC